MFSSAAVVPEEWSLGGFETASSWPARVGDGPRIGRVGSRRPDGPTTHLLVCPSSPFTPGSGSLLPGWWMHARPCGCWSAWASGASGPSSPFPCPGVRPHQAARSAGRAWLSAFIPHLWLLGQRAMHDNWHGSYRSGCHSDPMLLARIRIAWKPTLLPASSVCVSAARPVSPSSVPGAEPPTPGALPPVETEAHLRAGSASTSGPCSSSRSAPSASSWDPSPCSPGDRRPEVGFDDINADTVGTLFMGSPLVDLLSPTGSAWLADRIGRRWTMFSPASSAPLGAVNVAFSPPTGRPPDHLSPASASPWASATAPSWIPGPWR